MTNEIPLFAREYTKVSEMPREIFRQYDIRGQYDVTFSEDIVYTLACAIAVLARRQGETEIIIAHDGRLSSPGLNQALIAGLVQNGLDVLDLGLVPTPVLYFATHTLSSRTGIMLTASHNPPDYNGLKIVLAGVALSGESILALRGVELTTQQLRLGQYRTQNMRDTYIKHIASAIQLKRRVSLVLDCGNGVAGCIAGDVLRAIGCDVVELYCDVDGRFPNHPPDTSQEANLADLKLAVEREQAELGVALDGDGDRLAIVSAAGEMICPDRLLIIFAEQILANNPGAEIIHDVKCSWLLINAVQRLGGKATMWMTGHSLIKAKLRETNAELAGEMSGHIFFKDWYGFDDGLYAAARLLHIIAAGTHSATEIFATLPTSIVTPELRIAIAEADKVSFMSNFIRQADFPGASQNTIDGLRVDYVDGWGLIRPSNTSPYLILRFEAKTQAFLQQLQDKFRQLIQQINPELNLPF